MREERAQVFQVEEQQTLVVGDLEDGGQHTALRLVQVQDARQQQRPHLGYRRAQRMSLLAKHVPTGHRKLFVRKARELQHRHAIRHALIAAPDLRKARQIALHVRHKHRHTKPRKAFGQNLQTHRFSGAGRSGNQPVAVRELGQQGHIGVGVDGFGDEERIGHGSQRFRLNG